MVLRSGDSGPLHALVSVDTIGLPGALTKSIHARVEARHGISRSRFVLCCTHAHTTPHIAGGLVNLLAVPLSDRERSDTQTYTEQMAARIVDAVDAAVADLQPGRMFVGEGEATFAVNRRVLTGGVWSGFGVNADGPVDHSLLMIKVTSADGERVRGLVFNYACHCTTFGGDYNRVNGDWAGYAALGLEAAFPGAMALCTIGCGADQNPSRDSARAMEFAQAQGREIVEEVTRLVKSPLREITARPQAAFNYAGLPIDRPTREMLEKARRSDRPQVRQHAENMLAIWERMGRLPETYPMPVQVWKFEEPRPAEAAAPGPGTFAMVFLGGEVCVDYVHRIQKELGTGGVRDPALPITWVTAYANDVFGYVASERMRAEGGYEVDFSMIYYNQPGRWSTGTEDVILRRVREMYDLTGQVGPLSPEDALGTFTIPAGCTVELIASEPLIRDPINLALGADGRLWVVEMGDYPRGAPGTGDAANLTPGTPRRTPWDGPPGGTIKVLSDTDGDGRFDTAETFLDGLTFPTGVFPWRDGVLISGAPDILLARDTDGDGRADDVQPLYSGFAEDNPQHRLSGFVYGLDGWLELAAGTTNGEIVCHKTGERVNTSGRDVRIDPDSGRLVATSGRSQYLRTRDDWGNGFGNTNSDPLFHFAIDDRYLLRNRYVPSPAPRVDLTDPPRAPQVYPTSRTLDRFNDLFALDRFTSACGPHVFRDTTFGHEPFALICEPVHNLVSRVMLVPDGVTFRGMRHPQEQQAEFLSSTDNWFRPVSLLTAPDGALWVCDMYRDVIEHPEWIPEAWQLQLDLYAGSRLGRIYRIRRQDAVSGTSLPDFTRLTTAELVEQLAASNGWRRDTAQRLLVERDDELAVPALEALAARHPLPLARVHALSTLARLGRLSRERLLGGLDDADPRVVQWAVQLSEPRLAAEPELARRLEQLSEHESLGVRYQVALSLGESPAAGVAQSLLSVALRNPEDPWIGAAVVSSSSGRAGEMIQRLLADTDRVGSHRPLLQDLIATEMGGTPTAGAARVIEALAAARHVSSAESPGEAADWQLAALSSCVDALRRRGVSWSQACADEPSLREQAEPLLTAAAELARNPEAADGRRVLALPLLGHEPERREDDLAFLESLLSPRASPDLQRQAVRSLAALQPANVPQRLLAGWRGHTPALRGDILGVLLSRDPWVDELMQRLTDGTVTVQDLDTATRSRLSSHRRRPVRDAAQAILGESGSSSRQAVVAAYHGVSGLSGRADQGRLRFEKICSACHQHAGVGRDLAPRLANLQNKSTDALLTAILDPNQAVEYAYHGYLVVLTDGRVLTGLIRSETASSLTLVEMNGQEHVLLRIDIEELVDTGKSFMPEGFEKDMTPQDVADVMAFLRQEG
jgi:putative membrane-bound dehydrogenase-like protein